MNKKAIEVFDPAMCCSTGLCGPNVEPALARFAADLEWLAGRGVEVQRFNLAQQPGAFVEREPVVGALRDKGEGSLPLLLAGGELVSQGRYPSRGELASWAGLEAPRAALKPLPMANHPSSGCEQGALGIDKPASGRRG